MKGLLISAALVGGAAGAAWYHREHWHAKFPGSSQPIDTQRVSFSAEPEPIHAVGFVEGSRESADLRFEMAGRLVRLLVMEGQTVEQGEALAELDPSLWSQEVIQAQADLALAKAEWARLKNAARPETRQVAQAQVLVAQAELNHLREEAERTRRLHERGAASEREWKNAFHPAQIADARLMEKQALAAEVEAPAREDDLAVAQSKIAVAEATLAHAKLRLEKTRLLAPTKGVILHVGSEVGELVSPTDSKPLMVFSNVDSLRVRAYVEELHALQVSIGDSAEITTESQPDKIFLGTVIFCAPWMDQKQYRTHKPNELLDVRTREIVIELENANELIIGLPVDVVLFPRPADMPVDRESFLPLKRVTDAGTQRRETLK